MWDLPKGKIEKGETINEAAIREVCEETGLKDLTIVKDLNCTYHIYKSGSNWIIKKTYWFEMTTSQKGDLKPAIEEGISQAVWKDAKDAYSAINSSYISLKETFSEYFLKQIT